MPTTLKKRNREYNEQRKKQAELKKKDINHDKALQKIHENGVERIQGQIDTFFLRYATSEGLTIAEAKKKASAFDVTRYFDKAKRAVETRDFSPETNKWLKTYNHKMRISRLEVLKGELQLEILNMTEEKEKYISKALEESFESEYKAQRGEINRALNKHMSQTGIFENATISPSSKYRGIINADFYGQNFSERVWGYAREMDKQVQFSLTRIFTDMMGYQEERNRLKRKFNVSDYQAQRLLRTEMRRVNSQLQYEMLTDNGFTHMIYVTEAGACPVCAPMEGMAIPIDKIELGVNQPPIHPNCYCTMYGHIEMVDIYGNSTLDEFQRYIPEDESFNKGYGEERDPFRKVYGSMFDSHAKEVEEMIDELTNKGVRIEFSESEEMKYSPGNRAQKIHGSIIINRNSSYSAFMHERQHAIDDYKNRRPGMDYYILNREDRWMMEERAYDLEIEIYRRYNMDKNSISKIIEMKNDEKKIILGR